MSTWLARIADAWPNRKTGKTIEVENITAALERKREWANRREVAGWNRSATRKAVVARLSLVFPLGRFRRTLPNEFE
jgi:hypothetical protein